MQITILAGNLASNSTGRAILLAEVLSHEHNVKIVGPLFGKEIWKPAANALVTINAVPGALFPGFISSAKRILALADGQLLLACKPLLPSFGVALVAKAMRNCPIILDMDDDELAMTLPGKSASLTSKLRDPSGHLHTRIVNGFINCADGYFSIAERYKSDFGGVIVPHGRNVDVVNPQNFDRLEVRRQMGISPQDSVIGFVGTPRPHKGVDMILAAMERLCRPDMKLLIVGAVENDEYIKFLHSEFSQPMIILPEQPVEKMPYFLSAVDLVVLPQRDTPAARGQVPAKLFDAMAMAKPIVASAVGAIPDYLDKCGVLVPPDNIAALADGIARIVDDENYARMLGTKAREKCVQHYSFDVMLRTMNTEIDRVLRAKKDSRVRAH